MNHLINKKIVGGNVYINQNPQRISYQNVGVPMVNPQQQMRYISMQPQIVHIPNQQQIIYQYPMVAQQQIVSPQQQVIPQIQIQKNTPQQEISQLQNNIHQQGIVQQQNYIIQQAQKNIQLQPILPQQLIQQQNFIQKQVRKDSNLSDIQPIMPQQFLDYSGISVQYSQSPWFLTPRPDNSFALPQDKFISQNNLDVGGKEIQEIRPLDLTNYSNLQSFNNSRLNIQNDNDQMRKHQNKKSSLPEDVFISLNNLRNTLNSQNNYNQNQNNNQDAMNVSFSQDIGYQQEVGISYTPQKSLQNSRQQSQLQQQMSFIPSSHIISPNKSTIQGSTVMTNLIPSHSFQTNQIFDSAINQQLSHQRSKSAFSPLKSAIDSTQKNQQHVKFISPQRTFVSPTKAPIFPIQKFTSPEIFSKTPEGVSPNRTGASGKSHRSQSFKNVTPRKEQSGYKENSIVISQQIPIVGSVQLSYVSKYNPMPHYNNHPSQFHKSPERSKDAVSCVFFKQGQKMPSKIKIKYTPVEELLTKDELCEYQLKHKELNLISNDQNSNNQYGKLVASPLKQYNKKDDSPQNPVFEISRNNNQRSSLNFLTQAIDFLSQKGNATPDKRTKIEDIMKDMDPIQEKKHENKNNKK